MAAGRRLETNRDAPVLRRSNRYDCKSIRPRVDAFKVHP